MPPFAILVWILASAGFGFYVANFSSYNKTYGSLAGVIVFLLWLWLTNVALLFGAELDAELERGRELQAGIAAERDDPAARSRHHDDREGRGEAPAGRRARSTPPPDGRGRPGGRRVAQEGHGRAAPAPAVATSTRTAVRVDPTAVRVDPTAVLVSSTRGPCSARLRHRLATRHGSGNRRRGDRSGEGGPHPQRDDEGREQQRGQHDGREDERRSLQPERTRRADQRQVAARGAGDRGDDAAGEGELGGRLAPPLPAAATAGSAVELARPASRGPGGRRTGRRDRFRGVPRCSCQCPFS